MVREYSRNVEAVSAAGPDGRDAGGKDRQESLASDNSRRDECHGQVRVCAREMSVRTNWVEADFAMINGAPTFLTLADGAASP